MMGWGMSVGNALGGAAGLSLIETFGWRDALLSGAALMALLAGLAPLLPEPAAGAATPAVPARAARGGNRACGAPSPSSRPPPSAWRWRSPWRPPGWWIWACPCPRWAWSSPRPRCWPSPAPDRWPDWGCGALPAPRAVLASALLLTPPFALLAGAQGLLAARPWTLLSVFVIFSALAVQNVAFNTYFYSLARPGRAATDVTFLTAMMSVAAMAGFGASGFVAAAWGYGATLAAAAAGYAATALLAWRLAPAAGYGERHAR
ncbi:hypothetical protein WJ972_05420 [Achromobacter insuavis]